MATAASGTKPNGKTGGITSADEVVLARDRQIFILTAHPVELVTPVGEEQRVFYCPPSTYRKEEQIIYLLGDLVVPVLKLGFGGDDLKPEQIADITELLLRQDGGPAKLVTAAALLTGQDEDWVRDNMVIETIMGLVIPFFVAKWTSTRAVLDPLMTSAVAAVERQAKRPAA